MCVFHPDEMIAANTSPEAERLFQLGRAHDISIIANLPDTIPEDLRDKDPDRAVAKEYYQQAADMGHTAAMNNLAVYLHNGWGYGLGDYREDPRGAYRMNVEMARRSDPRGYVGMAGYLFNGQAGPVNEPKAVACLVAGAKLDDPTAIRLLAQEDLGLRDLSQANPHPPNQLQRGIDLLEEMFRRGDADAYANLASYHNYRTEDWPKFEYYAREGVKAGSLDAKTALVSAYLGEYLTENAEAQVACLEELAPADFPRLETLCPRPGGPSTRAAAGLPQAPAAMNVPSYLAAYAARYPEAGR